VSERPAPPARQLPLSLPHKAAMSRADFLLGEANRTAIELIDRWPLWPERGALLTGPAGSGKTHLVEIFRSVSGAGVIAAEQLPWAEPEALVARGAVAVEDLHRAPADETALFHLVNLAREQNVALLLTSRLAPAALRVSLPDLLSRLRATHPVALAAPDDELLRRVLTKLFADRQLTVEAAVVDFIALRIERSLEAANAIAARLDREALAAGRPVTKRLAGVIIAEMFDRQPDFWPEDAGWNESDRGRSRSIGLGGGGAEDVDGRDKPGHDGDGES
jgi:chromosomal replication initiation ATPase DnaA